MAVTTPLVCKSMPAVPPKPSPFARYLEQRLRPQRRWYERKATRCKRWSMGLQSAVIVLSAMIPLIVVSEPLLNPILDGWLSEVFAPNHLPVTWGALATALLSTCVMLLAGLEKLWQPQSQWFNYRANEEMLKKEEWLYLYRVGPYQGLDAVKAGRLLIERAEALISSDLDRFVSQRQTQSHDIRATPSNPTLAATAKPA
jgi:hypothetical protein